MDRLAGPVYLERDRRRGAIGQRGGGFEFAGGDISMTAFNVVPFRVKPGRGQEFLVAPRGLESTWAGRNNVNMIKTGERTYCIIAEWSDMSALAAARLVMIGTLDKFRDTLEDLGGGLGVTDPVAGPVVLAL